MRRKQSNKNIGSYSVMPKLYNLGSEDDPYIKYCYKINHVAEFLNVGTETVRGWIKKGVVPETPILLPVDSPHIHINYIRLYIWEQFEAFHLALVKYYTRGGFSAKNKAWVNKFIMEEWKKIPYISQFKPENFIYKPLSTNVRKKKD